MPEVLHCIWGCECVGILTGWPRGGAVVLLFSSRDVACQRFGRPRQGGSLLWASVCSLLNTHNKSEESMKTAKSHAASMDISFSSVLLSAQRALPIYHLHWSTLMTDGRYGWGRQIAFSSAWLHRHVQAAQTERVFSGRTGIFDILFPLINKVYFDSSLIQKLTEQE